jgi:hypothetical protein
VVVIEISEPWLIMLFTEGLIEPLRGWVKFYMPHTLQDAILCTRDLEDLVPRIKLFPNLLCHGRTRIKNHSRESGMLRISWMVL